MAAGCGLPRRLRSAFGDSPGASYPTSLESRRYALVKIEGRHLRDPVRQVGVAAHLPMETCVRGDDPVLLLDGEREIEAVVDRVVEVNRKPSRRRREFTRGEGDSNRCRSQCIDSVGKILRVDVTTAMRGPQRIADLGEKELRSDRRRSGFEQARRFVGPVPLRTAFQNGSGIDDIALQGTLSRSLSARMVSLPSMEDFRRSRNSLAREAKFCSPSRSTLRRISLCSASTERPWAAALRFSERITCGDTFRTVSCAMIFACNETCPLLSSM